MHQCIIISGLSGSGKTTVGKAFCQSREANHDIICRQRQICQQYNWTFIDGDWFYLAKKPQVQLSNGEMVSNWDAPESINWEALNQKVKKELNENNVLIATFLPIIEKYEFPVYKHIRLSMGNKQESINRCIAARIISKKIVTIEKVQRDELIVKELVYPVYERMMQEPVNDVVMVHDQENKRKDVNDLVSTITKMIFE